MSGSHKRKAVPPKEKQYQLIHDDVIMYDDEKKADKAYAAAIVAAGKYRKKLLPGGVDEKKSTSNSSKKKKDAPIHFQLKIALIADFDPKKEGKYRNNFQQLWLAEPSTGSASSSHGEEEESDSSEDVGAKIDSYVDASIRAANAKASANLKKKKSTPEGNSHSGGLRVIHA
jgi:hypothetical protein